MSKTKSPAILKVKTIAILLFGVCGACSVSTAAINVTTSYTNTTYDNDNNSREDSSSSQVQIGSSSNTLSDIGNSSGNMGYRFTGQASAYGTGELTQTIRTSVTWTVTAEDWEEYSITFSPEIHAYLNIWDWSTDETDDDADFNSLSTSLTVNGSTISDSLNGLTGYQKSTTGSYDLNRTDSQTLTGYTGNNTFTLSITGTVYVDAHADGGLFDNPTANAVLWGQDGTLTFPNDTDHNNFDNYSSSSARNADGIFIDADIEFTAVPEPAAAALLISLSCFTLSALRRRARK